MINRTMRGMWAGLALVLVVTAAPAAAQTSNDEARLRKLESEVRALQRKVFPGGDPRFFEPEISAQAQPATANAPSTTAVTDILMRLDALEAQIAALTAQTEQNSNGLVQLTTRVVALENGAAQPGAAAGGATSAAGGSTTDTNLAAMTGGASAAGAAAPAKATPTPTPAPTQATAAGPAPAKPATGPSAARLAAVQQIAKPQTDDPADDEYSYGYRLWNAGFYPEAQQQLTMYVEKYPTHWRISYGRNLLGRAYLDDGKPRDAAAWFLKNYQTDKQADRAPDSLLYLAESMIALKDTSRACIALAEFGETYPAIATGRLATQYQGDLNKVKCN